jgi:hypothetical protein
MDLRQPGTFPGSIDVDVHGGLGFFRCHPARKTAHPVEINKSIQISNKTVQFNTNSDAKRIYFPSLFPSLFAWLCSPL